MVLLVARYTEYFFFIIYYLFYIIMGESSKFPKSLTLEIQMFKLAGCLQKLIVPCLNAFR